MTLSLFASVALNALALASLVFVTVRESQPPPPTLLASTVPQPPDPLPVDPPTMHRPTIAPAAGGAASLAPSPVFSTSASPFSLTVPNLPSVDNGQAGIEGLGRGFGIGPGVGAGQSGTAVGSMKIGKVAVKSNRLGVILDVSGSMEEHLRVVRRDIRTAFRSAETVEVEGCRLDAHAKKEGEELPPVKLKSKADSVIEAVEMLVVHRKIDALYWFSDLQDGETKEGLARLGELLRLEKGRGRAVRLYIRTLKVKPSTELTRIVRASGGAIQAGDETE